MKVETNKLTTGDLLRLEDAGGILTDAIPPSDTMPSDSLHVWFSRFPLVDGKLVARWYDLYRAKVALQVEIDRLTSNAVGQATGAAVCARSPGPEGYTAGGNNGEANAGPDTDHA
jgi:hypothetical protein